MSSSTSQQNVKEQVRNLLNDMPDNCTWDDLMYRIYVRQAVEKGLADADAGRTKSLSDVRKSFGLTP